MIETGIDLELFRGENQSKIGNLGFGDGNTAMYVQELMMDHYVELRFSYPTPLNIKRGDYINFLGLKLAIRDNLAAFYNSNRRYEYVIRFEAPEMFLKDHILFYRFQDLEEISWSLTSQARNFMQIIVDAANPILGGGYTVGVVEPLETLNIQFDGTDIFSGLNLVSETFECEWYINYKDKTLNLVKSYEYGEPYQFTEDEVVIDIKKTNYNEEDYFTRLLVFGGSKNIPPNYRTPATGTPVDAIVQKQLRMPEEYGNYIDFAPSIPEYMKKTKIVTFDHIYPKRISTVSDIKINDRVTDENGNPFIIYYIKDEGLQFKSDYVLQGETLQLTFEIGSWLAGRTFDLSYHDTGEYAGYFEIINDQTIPNNIIPNDILRPRVGDKFVIFGFDIQLVSDQYIPEAEEELRQEALKYADSMLKDNATYNCVINPVTAAKNKIDLKLGQRVKIISPGLPDGHKLSRVRGYYKDLVTWLDLYIIGAKDEYIKNGISLRQKVAENRKIADMQYIEAMKQNKQNHKTVQALNYIRTALQNETSIEGGLILTSLLQLGLMIGDTWQGKAGINGILTAVNDIALWIGGNLDDAVEEKTPIGFRADGSGWLASKNILWDALGNLLVTGKYQTSESGQRFEIDPQSNSLNMFDGANNLILTLQFYEGGISRMIFRHSSGKQTTLTAVGSYFDGLVEFGDRVIMKNLPMDATGLGKGDLYISGDTIKIKTTD